MNYNVYLKNYNSSQNVWNQTRHKIYIWVGRYQLIEMRQFSKVANENYLPTQTI